MPITLVRQKKEGGFAFHTLNATATDYRTAMEEAARVRDEDPDNMDEVEASHAKVVRAIRVQRRLANLQAKGWEIASQDEEEAQEDGEKRKPGRPKGSSKKQKNKNENGSASEEE